MNTILNQIIENKEKEVAIAQRMEPVQRLQEKPLYHRQGHSLSDRLRGSASIIAEFKRKSPSKGEININAKVQPTVQEYAGYGAAGISVLTDEKFFGGDLYDFSQAREVLAIPLLRKDFIISEYQIHQSKAYGADVILLIAACLSPLQVQQLSGLAKSLGMETLLELHTQEELGHYHPGIDLVGINNRDLHSFSVDLSRSASLASQLPPEAVRVAESGIHSVEDCFFLLQRGFNGVLMGEYFMKHEKPGLAFKNFNESL